MLGAFAVTHVVLVNNVEVDCLWDTVLVGHVIIINLEIVVNPTVDVRRYVTKDTVAVVLAIKKMDDIALTLTNVVAIHAEMVETVWTKLMDTLVPVVVGFQVETVKQL